MEQPSGSTKKQKSENSAAQVEPLTYSVEAFCKAVGVGATTTYKLIKEGKLKTVKIAGRRLIPATEARRLIQEAA